MLNSKYAPIVALTALGIIVVVVLGWFLAVKPQIDETAAFSADEDLVRTNITTIESDSAAISAMGDELATYEPLQPLIDLNAPQRLDLETFRTRMWDAFESSGVEVGETAQDFGDLIDGWEIPAVLLPSSELAKRFQTGPAATTSVVAPAFTPAVKTVTGTAVLAQNLALQPFEFTVYGTVQESYDFLQTLQDPEQPFLQVYEVTQTSLVEGATVPAGVSDVADGDVQTYIKAALYLSDADLTSLDEGTVAPAESIPEDAFMTPTEDSPAQPGAN
ncbi:MAG: hypothetical protein ACK5IM_03515 [Demequina sp.]|uniref:hypothetical protein n=1 Tax=Demequina sp. TaxID=2050685 RepID=UPI003A880C71